MNAETEGAALLRAGRLLVPARRARTGGAGSRTARLKKPGRAGLSSLSFRSKRGGHRSRFNSGEELNATDTKDVRGRPASSRAFYSGSNIGCMASSRADARSHHCLKTRQLSRRFRYVSFRPISTPSNIPAGRSE